MVLPINFQRSPADINIMYNLIAGAKNSSVKAEFIDLPCEKLEGIAQVNTRYFLGKGSRFLAGFECKQAEDCGISRSPFSNTFNYTVHCPLYITLENRMALEES